MTLNSLYEDHAGNLFHFALYFIVATIYLFLKSSQLRKRTYFILCSCGGFILFSFVLKWQPWHSRLHLPVFLLVAPWASTIIHSRQNNKFTSIVMTLLIIGSLPYVFLNVKRPLTGPQNLLITPRSAQYLRDKESMDHVNDVLDYLVKTDCNQVGFVSGWDDWEYPLWALANARRVPLRIEHIFIDDPYNFSRDFDPCAALFLLPRDDNVLVYNKVVYFRAIGSDRFSF